MTYTWEQLDTMTPAELDKILQEKNEELYQAKKKRTRKVQTIMFLQQQIQKESK